MNNVSLIGRIGSDLELRKTTNGVSVCDFNLAIKSVEKTVWIKVVAWRKNAELICNYLKKGELIGINGSIDARTYEKNGENRKLFEIIADKVYFLGKNQNKENSASHNNDGEIFGDLPF